VSNAQEPRRYEIRVTGHLADRWVAWFDGMTLTRQDDGTTVIDGLVVDQSALHGLLRKISDLGLELVRVTRTPADQTPAEADRPHPTGQHPRRSTS
jgi:hypothetical protein